MKLGFIGYGNMASAIISGIVKADIVPAGNILISEHFPEKCEQATALGFTIAADVEKLVNDADMIFICVKPKDFSLLLESLKITNYRNKTYVSIAAGITIKSMAKTLGETASIIRAMPNTPLLLGAGTTALCRNGATSDESFALAKRIFASAGTVYEIPENEFNNVINLNGSSPAYIYLFAKTVAEYASQNGDIPYSTCLSMFCDTLKGSAEMLKQADKTADELISMVSSPGGTTVAALEAFKATGFTESLQAGMSACVNRAEELGSQ